MGQFFSLHNCHVMHYNSKLICNGNYISIAFELHFHMVTFLHPYGHFSAYISTNKKCFVTSSFYLSSDTEFISDYLDTDKVAKYSDSHSKQLDIQNALVLYVAGDLLPLSTVESPYFRNLAQKNGPSISSSQQKKKNQKS